MPRKTICDHYMAEHLRQWCQREFWRDADTVTAIMWNHLNSLDDVELSRALDDGWAELAEHLGLYEKYGSL